MAERAQGEFSRQPGEPLDPEPWPWATVQGVGPPCGCDGANKGSQSTTSETEPFLPGGSIIVNVANRAERRRRTCTKSDLISMPRDTCGDAGSATAGPNGQPPGSGKAPPGSPTTRLVTAITVTGRAGPADDHLVEAEAPSAAVAVEWSGLDPQGPDPSAGPPHLLGRNRARSDRIRGHWAAPSPAPSPLAGHVSPETPPHWAVAQTAPRLRMREVARVHEMPVVLAGNPAGRRSPACDGLSR